MKKHSTKQFTLIEMMVVMAIIAILAGILFPAVMAVKDKAKAKETQTLVASVSTAIMQFKGEYNYLPSPDTSTPGKDEAYGSFDKNNPRAKPDNKYRQFFDVLTYSNHANKKGGPSTNAEDVNTKGITFLTAPNSYFSENDFECSMRDSWGQGLVVKLDYGGDDIVDIGSGDVGTSVNWTFKTQSVVLSAGKQNAGELNKDEFIGSPRLDD